jgi:hypothetical protein
MRFAALAVLISCASVRAPAPAPEPPAARDGARDFDWEIGTWKTSLRRLVHPLTGSAEWTTMEGTSLVRKVWDGRANLVELVADGATGHFEGLSLRLYDPMSRRWSLNFASSRSGEVSPPTIGGFDATGRGEFIGHETLGDKPILVRFVISALTPTSYQFEQAFSADHGATWEVNWIAVDTRVAL